MNVTEELADWEDSRSMDRKRQWFTIDEALEQLALHKPVQRRYLQQLKNSRNNMTTETMTALNVSNQIPESSSSLEIQTTDSGDAAASITNNTTATNTNTLTAEQQSSSSNNSSLTASIQQSTNQTATAI